MSGDTSCDDHEMCLGLLHCLGCPGTSGLADFTCLHAVNVNVVVIVCPHFIFVELYPMFHRL